MNSTAGHRPNPAQLVLASRPALAYLAVVTAAGLFTVWSTSTHDAPDADLSGVWPIFATLPWSLPLMTVTPENPAAFAAVIAISALVNATLIAWATRRRS
ncbi:SCO4225 family membrane protein [Kineosporia succinea]|uniref:SPW repeat-containing protein n=1 Tax=Kineosporia succinea TaxID=84632 RepID=A0ABT9PFD3_9ACTN|nr:hypothetical protein [Kineosporia succinea]MDP9831167.1 hypothetical protein [Kineosporia succinea]